MTARETPTTPRETRGEPGRVSVPVLTGFLGASNTTLLNRILAGNHGKHLDGDEIRRDVSACIAE